ncbi:MAG: glycosyltransferase family 4 protein [Mycobacteriales bacterium]|nr:glycosyltransferase family 4 protein [Mycobacteriales bacterium]
MTGSAPLDLVGREGALVEPRSVTHSGRRSRRRERSRPTGAHLLVLVQNLSVPMDRRVWQECTEAQAAGWRVSVVCPMGAGDVRAEVLDGVRIHRYRAPREGRGPLGFAREFLVALLRMAHLVVRVARRERVHVVQACNPPDTMFLIAGMLRLWQRTRFVYDQHDLCPEIFLSRGGTDGALLHRILVLLERFTFRLADVVVFPNEAYRQRARALGRLRVPSYVVMSGPRRDSMRAGPPQLELAQGREHLLVYLGVMGPQDGVDHAVDALAELVHRHRLDVHCAFLGFGDQRERLMVRAEELGLADYCSWPGRVGPEQIKAYLSTASLGIAPDPANPLANVSTHNKVLEYMAHGLPMVCYALQETQRVAGSAAAVSLVQTPGALADVAARLLLDPEERRQRGLAARARLDQNWVWESQAPDYVRAIAQAADRLAAPGATEDLGFSVAAGQRPVPLALDADGLLVSDGDLADVVVGGQRLGAQVGALDGLDATDVIPLSLPIQPVVADYRDLTQH